MSHRSKLGKLIPLDDDDEKTNTYFFSSFLPSVPPSFHLDIVRPRQKSAIH